MNPIAKIFTRKVYSFNDPKIDFTSDKLVINMPTEKNIVEFSRSDEEAHRFYLNLMEHNYMFYHQHNNQSYFIKRRLLHTIWQRKDLIKYGDLFYTIENILPTKVNKLAPLRLIVIFSSMPSAEDYKSPNIAKRCFTRNYPSIQKHILKNTMVMRIMDANYNTGSMYLNTENYPNFESDVQMAVNFIVNQYKIHKENVVFYGGSKGGTGALYHSYLGNYKACVVDPIINLQEHNERNDIMFLKELCF